MGLEQIHDVIVVGAGPAGATTATILAQQGHDVLLLDRHDFPRDKTCGDAVPAGAIEIMTGLGMGEKIETAVSRGEFYPLKQMRLVSPKGHMLLAKFHKGQAGSDSYVAPRLYFDAVIQQHAVDSGATFVKGVAKEPLIEDGQVVGVRARVNGHVQDIRSRVVVGADGVTSVITRALRPKQNKHIDRHRAVALRAYIEDIEVFQNEVEFYLYDEILPGYAWIFPIGENRANIGLGMRLDHFRKQKGDLNKMLQTFLKMPAIKKRLKAGGKLRDVATWQLNFGSQKKLQHVFDGALLVGDAAGLINPLTGGGIHNCLVSAQHAAETIHRGLDKGDLSRSSLRPYETLVKTSMWNGMKRSYSIQRWLLRYPVLVDFLIRRMKENSSLAQTFLTKL